MDALKKAEQAKTRRSDEQRPQAMGTTPEQASAHTAPEILTLADTANASEKTALGLADAGISLEEIEPQTPPEHEELELPLDEIETLEPSSLATPEVSERPPQIESQPAPSKTPVAGPVQKAQKTESTKSETRASPTTAQPIVEPLAPASDAGADQEKASAPAAKTTLPPHTAPMLIGKRKINRTYLWAGLVTVLALIGVGYYLMAILDTPRQSSVVAPAATNWSPAANPPSMQPPAAETAPIIAAPSAAVQQPIRASADTPESKENVAQKTKPQSPQPKPATVAPSRTLTIQRTEVEDPLYRLLQQAYSNYQSGELGHARQRYRQALERDDGNRDALLGLAAIAHKQGRLNDARALYRRLLALNPKDSIATAGMMSLIEQGASSGNITQLKLMLSEEPSAAHLHFALGNEYAAQSLWPRAQQAYFEAYRHAPSNADYAFNLAVSLEHMGQTQAALKYYRQALEANPENTPGFDPQHVAQRIKLINTPVNTLGGK